MTTVATLTAIAAPFAPFLVLFAWTFRPAAYERVPAEFQSHHVGAMQHD
jgi:hypothetical protein